VTLSPGQKISVGPGKVPLYLSVVYRPPAIRVEPVAMCSVTRSLPCELKRMAGSGKPSRMTGGNRAAQWPRGFAACAPTATGRPTRINTTATAAAQPVVSATWQRRMTHGGAIVGQAYVLHGTPSRSPPDPEITNA